ncbi:MAG: DUF131 domain-containing protein [Candidatus Bathyarchaeia archaeon]
MTESEEGESNDERGVKKLFLMFTIGFLAIFVGVVLLAVAAFLSGGSVDIGGVIFIWFIPIVFGAGPHVAWVILFALILTVLSIIIFLISYRRR